MILFPYTKIKFNNTEIMSMAKRIKENDEKLFELFLKNGSTKEEIVSWVENYYRVKYINLSKEKLEKKILDIPNINLMKNLNAIPYKIEKETIYIAHSDISDLRTKDNLINLFKETGNNLIFDFAFINEIKDRYKKIEDMEVYEVEEVKDIKDRKENDVSFDATGWVNRILNNAINYNASDIHIEHLEKGLQVRYRVDGILTNKEIFKIPLEARENITNRIKVISGMNPTENRKAQDGRIEKYRKNGREYDFRISSVKGNFGEKIVMRIFDTTSEILTFEQLGFDNREKEKILKMLKKNNGIIYLAGATGSGKTTTLYTMIDSINNDEVNIYTIENPIEKTVENVTQIQIDETGGVTYIDTLSALLRQDPDVIVVGETRDSETANLAIRASLTGHLVMTTIHANNSIDTISRLIDMKIEPYLLSGSALGFISQRLIRKLCPHCKKEVKREQLQEYEIKWIEETIKEFKMEIPSETSFYTPVGCEGCNKGYKGRTALTETIVVTEKIKTMITNKEETLKIKKIALEEGFQPFSQNGLELVLSGKSSVEEVISKIL